MGPSLDSRSSGSPIMSLSPSPPRGASPLPAEWSGEEVVSRRSGDVLLRHTILKSDHFPGCQNFKLGVIVDGAPNFRAVPQLPIYGVATATASGVRRVLDALGAARGARRVLWHNLREEPVVYINGEPYVVREADKPFANLEYTGIDRVRLESMEARLKADVLREATRYGNSILVAGEDDAFQVTERWAPVSEADVQTPADVYRELLADSYDVDYLRVPVTDEKAPKPRDFDLLTRRLWHAPRKAALVFNCQMGRGRTTTGMAIAALLALRKGMGLPFRLPRGPGKEGKETKKEERRKKGDRIGDRDSKKEHSKAVGLLEAAPEELASLAPSTPDWLARQTSQGPSSGRASPTPPLTPPGEAEVLRSGLFPAVRSLLRALSNGSEAKDLLDRVLDACAAMQNLREAIATYRDRLARESNDLRREQLLTVALEYLERYYALIVYAAYLGSVSLEAGLEGGFDGEEGEGRRGGDASRASALPPAPAFSAWLAPRPELRSILARLLRLNPLAALALNRRKSAAEDVAQDAQDAAHAAVVAGRAGAVLGPYTVLKQDHFPGCQSRRLPLVVPGAPNFRGIPAVRVYGGAIPTLGGMRRLLRAVGAAPAGEGEEGEGAASGQARAQPSCSAVWIMMREEPVVYISGAPYVLREAARLFKNLMEYSGIGPERLEQMEERLRDDVVQEAARGGGRLLVVSETGGPGADEERRDGAEEQGAGEGGGQTEGAGEARRGGRKRGEKIKAGGKPHPEPPAEASPLPPPPNPPPAAASSRSAAQRLLVDEMVRVRGQEDVRTPREVAQLLRSEGYRLSYRRVPLTDGAAPQARDLDAFYAAAAGAAPSDALVFTCQLGGGRTTTGMVVGTLLRQFLNGAVLEQAPAEQEASLLHVDEDLGPGAEDEDEEEAGEEGGAEGGGEEAEEEELRGTSGSLDGEESQKRRQATLLPHVSSATVALSFLPRMREGAGGAGPSPFQTDRHERGGGRDEGRLERAGSGRAESPPPAAHPPDGAEDAPWASARRGGASRRPARGTPAAAAASAQPSPRPTPQQTPQPAALGAGDQAAGGWEVEARNLRDGEYVAVRRFVRTLERGADAKASVDAAVDACGALVNLRTAIQRYRLPRSVGRFHRPELRARHAAFQMGSAFLERYCLLIAFAVYLSQCASRGRRWTFAEWMAARPDVRGAQDFIHSNPAAALAPVPAVLELTPAHSAGGLGAALGSSSALPAQAGDRNGADSRERPGALHMSISATVLAALPDASPYAAGPLPPGRCRRASGGDERRVLALRRGLLLGRRTILKSLPAPLMPPRLAGQALTGLDDVRAVQGLPLLAVGGGSAEGLRRLLAALGAGPGGEAHVVVTDVREEMVLFVGGAPFFRRELEMPAAALHHAGVSGTKLEDMERKMRADMVAEAHRWGGAVLLHREAPASAREDITRPTAFQRVTEVQPFWASVGDLGDVDLGLSTPQELFAALAAEGFHLSYRRVPLSRERTPASTDADWLGQVMIPPPSGGGRRLVHVLLSRAARGSSARFAASLMAAVLARREARAAAARAAAAEPSADLSGISREPGSPSQAGPGGPRASQISAQLSTQGSGALSEAQARLNLPRLALLHWGGGQGPASPRLAASPLSGGPREASPRAALNSPAKRARLADSGEQEGAPPRTVAPLLRGNSDFMDLGARSTAAGEYRGIMNLCRVLVRGLEAKAAADAAVDRCANIGNLRADIEECRRRASDAGDDPQDVIAARRLGLHYLQRYFYLIAYLGYLDCPVETRQPLFSQWMSERRELRYLLETLELE